MSAPGPADASTEPPQDAGRTPADWLQELAGAGHYAAPTVAAYRRDLAHLQSCYPGQALPTLTAVELRRALAQLHRDGSSPRSLARMLSSWRQYYHWLVVRHEAQANPSTGLRAPRTPRPLPKALSVDETLGLLERGVPTVASSDPVHQAVLARDQAMFELLYSSGLRLAELVALDTQFHREPGRPAAVAWLDLPARTVFVLGKGGLRRDVPLGTVAAEALALWLARREHLVRPATQVDPHALFLGQRGGRIAPRVVQLQLAQRARAAGLGVHVHPHVLRHSFASHLLQSSQDLRAVQELLGHASVTSTQIYTRLDFQHLAATYDATHPRARRKTRES